MSRRDLARSLAAASIGAAVGSRSTHAWGSGIVAALAPTSAPLRIGSNENPYGLGSVAAEAFQTARQEANRYPRDVVKRLVSRLATMHGVTDEAVLLAPGSGSLLYAAAMAFTSPTRSLLTAAPTFEIPNRVAAMTGAPVQAVPVTASGGLDLAAMAARASGAGFAFVCNPNNPTGSAVSAAAVKDFIARVRRVAPDSVVLVDEAYYEYVEAPSYATAIPLTRADPRVLVTRTFSKIHGMAGLRLGYAIAQPDTIEALRRYLGQATLSGASIATATASLADAPYIARQRVLNHDARAFTRRAFEEAGFRVLPSETNFLMVDVRRDAAAVRVMCREANVQIARPFPPLTTHVRVSIGTLDEMRQATRIILPLLSAPASARYEHVSLVDEGWDVC